MSDFTYTPGPWDFRGSVPSEGFDCFWIGPQGASIEVATVSGPQSSQFRAANARLIAAAPDLYAACLAAKQWLSGWASAEPYLAEIDAALSKATNGGGNG